MRVLPYSFPEGTAVLDEIPDTRGVFLLAGKEGSEPHLGKTARLRSRLRRLLTPAENGSRRLNLHAVIRQIQYQAVGSDFEADWELYQQARRAFPERYRRWLRLRMPAMVRLNLANPYPRVHVTRGLGRPPSLFLGPFPSRARAEAFASDFLDQFKLRRCVDDLAPDPAFPGCIYSEMNMCLAPCRKACTDAEYDAETRRVELFLRTRGESLRMDLEALREQASQELEFERAALLHARLEKLPGLLRAMPPAAREIGSARGVVVQPAADAQPGQQPRVTLFLFDRGGLHGPLPITLTTPQPGDPLEAWMGEQISRCFDQFPRLDRKTRNDHLALLTRWLFRSHRKGEFLLWNRGEAAPRRAITRACARVLRGEQQGNPEADRGAGA